MRRLRGGPHDLPSIGAIAITSRGRARITDRVARLTDRIREAEAEARLLDQQLTFLRQVADDARVDHVVADTRVTRRALGAARRDVDTHDRLLGELRDRIAAWTDERDVALEELLSEERT